MVSLTSTQSLTSALRRSVLDTQTQLTKAQKEVSTGRLADLGLGLGASIRQDYFLGFRDNSLSAITDSNTVISGRLSTTDATLGGIVTDAQGFLDTLVNAQSGAGASTSAIRDQATSGLNSLISRLDTTVSGDYIFAGINSGQRPVADYFSSPTSAAKQAVDQAFSNEFGTTQDSASASAITDTQMQTFLSGTFADLFSASQWATNWSTASDTNVTTRISLSQTSQTSVNANEDPVRQLAKAYTMVADLGGENLNDATYRQLLKTAASTISSAISGLTAMRANVGAMQKSISDANTDIATQRDILAQQIGSLENVDPYEASTRVSNLTTQLETSYTLTAKMQQLTLAKYL